ncbi:F0F1 ATP synthase subunit epsilon [Sinorhizobium fredii USDA 205]|uniref:ATP synthase epsilon chain n=1 Tax=Rhizobium fredii TaxID=380 RepID=A0A2A6M018_RHIFR|nr:F0F1 ATP synthase subunit epsilon [Sinorhizobium fredii]KSV87232.1 F0F1 ATP synthase subunit epsilon [Sinorhizobium fredii USDA 205]MCG5475691.1 F0F1 ATP synthase subunit epsilon [Sinorhizobium fredii]MQW94476.1 F0F1 ATP synthase subunit epsilon [Sinorhizobium fredii]MQX10515.1 F0F1 ATP synthase subunit epsilon [Sinorhizobium fredii]PDT48114.1 F0F1 ATP synthase subunit epsilon [Sinorhizobium fredii]
MADSFNFELVSPERLLLSAQVTEVVIPATEGEMTVMANHAPTMTTIKPGVVTVKTADGKSERFAVFGGFADILPTGCTLLAESAVHVDELDRTVLENRIDEARAELEGAIDEKKTRIEQFIAELTRLGEIVIPA